VRKGAVVGAGLAMVALVAGGCSGDDDRLTAAEVSARGDAVCERFQGEVTAVAAEFPQSITFTPQQMQEFWQKLVPKIDAAIEDFEEIEPPKDLEDEMAAAVAQAGKDRETLVAAGESPEAAQALYESQQDPFAATNEKLAAVGITACSDDGTTEGDAGEGAEGGETTTTAPAETTTTSTP
jgi:hypothetical protein